MIHTHKGHIFDPKTVKISKVEIEDIAHALSHICRFSGHCGEFYSVAEHSLLVCDILQSLGYDAQTCLDGLLHDASEAYLGDVTTPVKALLPDYKKIEEKVQRRIYRALKIKQNEAVEKDIKSADKLALRLEFAALLNIKEKGKFYPNIKIRVLAPKKAKSLFLQRYKALRGV